MHSPRNPGCGFQYGFTLVELVMTIIIVGIISAVAIPRFIGNDVFQSRGAADQAKAALRYGQKVAIAQHRNVSVTITSGSASDCGAALSGGNINCVIQGSVPVAPALPMAVKFNALGQPLDEFEVPFAANATLNVGDTAVTIERETGYVH